MRFSFIRSLGCLFFLGAIALAPLSPGLAETPLQAALARLTPEQRAVFKAYEAARIAYTRRLDQYWRRIEIKRRARSRKQARGRPVTAADYVKEEPPAYTGPKRPDEIFALLPKPPAAPAPPRPAVPVVGDFLREAQANYGFAPDRVTDEEFMIYYALEAMKLGLTKDQVVRVYALETGGVGTYQLQSGYNPRTGHAASTALGYAQLLAANTIEQMQKKGDAFAERLERIAADPTLPEAKARSLRAKAAAIRRMSAQARRIPDRWSRQVEYAKTPKGFAMHAVNLDGDVGPWMQVVKLKDIMDFAAKKGKLTLTGAELELMNLAGPGHGFEMLQPIGRTMPTANFFERKGYERNPVVAGKTGAELLAKLNEIMDRNVQKPGAVKFAEVFDVLAQRLGAHPAPQDFEARTYRMSGSR